MHISSSCSNCSTKTRCRKRDFSEQAWSVLLAWGEVDPEVVDQPVCDDCYVELRDILIDRATDVEVALASPTDLRAQIAAAKAAPKVVAKTTKKMPAPAKKSKPAAARSTAAKSTGKRGKSAPAKKGRKLAS